MDNSNVPKTYTELKPKFYLYKEQEEEVYAWMLAHDAEKHIKPGEDYRDVGAIGGAYTWELTPTTLGVVIAVRCCCGEKIDVTDYDSW